MGEKVCEGTWGRSLAEWQAWAESVGHSVDFYTQDVEVSKCQGITFLEVFPSAEEEERINRERAAAVRAGTSLDLCP